MRLNALEKEADARLTDALKKGDQVELARELDKVKKAWTTADRSVVQAMRDHASLFKSELLGRQLLSSSIGKAKKILDDLHDQGQIPNQTIPVLEERLNQPACICGESLDPSDPQAKVRRDHIKSLIEASRNSDEVRKKITALFYSSKELLTPVSTAGWIGEYSAVYERRQQAESVLAELGERQRVLEQRIDSTSRVSIFGSCVMRGIRIVANVMRRRPKRSSFTLRFKSASESCQT